MLYQVKAGTITIPTSDTVTAGTTTEVLNGQLGCLMVSVPAMTGTGTATILGTEAIGGTVYVSTAVNESAKATVNTFGTPAFFDGTLWLTATANGTQASAINITYNLYYAAKQG